jgi:hypothetical protein
MRTRMGLLLVFVVAACAEDGKDGLDGTPVDAEDLPVGSAQCPNGGVLLTVGIEERAVCNGAVGATGATGATGTPGMDADGYQPTVSILCNASVDLVNGQAGFDTPQIIGTDGIDESYFQYSAVVYSNKDVQATCGVTFGTVETSSGGAYYAGTSMGAANRYCQVSIDYPPAPASGGNGGVWAFTVNAEKTPIATYSDMDANHPLNGDFIDFFEEECVVRKFVGGAWVAGTFADL